MLQRGVLALLLTIFFLGAAGHCQSVQGWPEVDLSLNIKRTNLLIPSLSRFDSKLHNPQFVATGAIGTYRINRRWTASLGYLFAALPQQDDVAHVPLAALTAGWASGRCRFSDVNRFERLMAYSTQPYRYRNRVTADYAFGRSQVRHLYVSDEFFVNLSDQSWNQNRMQAGLGVLVHPRIRLDSYFLQRSARSGKENAVIGTVVTIVLNRPHA